MAWPASICFILVFIVYFGNSNNLIAVRKNNTSVNVSETIEVLDEEDSLNDFISINDFKNGSFNNLSQNATDVINVTNVTNPTVDITLEKYSVNDFIWVRDVINSLQNATDTYDAKNVTNVTNPTINKTLENVIPTTGVTSGNINNMLERVTDKVNLDIAHIDSGFSDEINASITEINNIRIPSTNEVNKTREITITIENDIVIFDDSMKEMASVIPKSFDKNTSIDILFKTLLEFWTTDMARKHGNRALWDFCGRLCSRKYHDLKDPFRIYQIECLECSCDRDCHMYGDCCLRDPRTTPKPLYDCKRNVERGFLAPAVYALKPECSGNWTDKERRDLCKRSSSCVHLPVTTKIGVTYLNEHCAVCNMEDTYMKWGLHFEEKNDFKNYRSVQSSILSLLKCNTKLLITPPPEVRNPKSCDQRRSYDVIDTCNVTGLWADHDDILETQCLEHHTPFYHRGDKKVYENMYCFLCNGKWFKSGIMNYNNDDINLTRMLFEIVLKESEELRGPSCNATWGFYIPHQNSCKTIECSEHLEYKEEECVPLSNDSKILHFMMNISSIKNIRQKIKSSLKTLGIDRYIAILGVIDHNVYLHIFCHSKFRFAAKLLSLVKSDWTFGTHVTINDQLLKNKWKKIWQMISDDVYMSCCKGSVDSAEQKAISFEVSDFSICPYVEFDETEIESAENDTVTLQLKYINMTFKKGEYQHQGDQKILICINTIKKKFDEIAEKGTYYDPYKSKHIEILQNIMSTLSLACLALTFLTYLKFPVLRTIPAKNNMALIISLFVAQLALIAATYLHRGTQICKMIGVFVHYSWLSVFFWMNVCSYHMFTVFRSVNAYSLSSNGHWKYLLKYLLFANGTPVLIVSTVITVSMTTTNTIGYGAKQCYLDNFVYIGISTILPLLIVLCSNLLFLGITIHDISAAANIAKASGKDRQHMIVYIKLSTLTGLFWTFEILSNFFFTEVFIIISAIFNYGQGILIFLSYVGNKRVAKLWLDRYRKN